MMKKILGLAATAALALGATSAQAATIPLGGTVTAAGDVVEFGSNTLTSTSFSYNFDFEVFSAVALNMESAITYNLSTDVTSFGVKLQQCSAMSTGCSDSETYLSIANGRFRLLAPLSNGFYRVAVNGVANSSSGNSFSGQAGFSAVPEPATMGLFGLGLAAVGLVRRRRKA